DWSSYVCSSDLTKNSYAEILPARAAPMRLVSPRVSPVGRNLGLGGAVTARWSSNRGRERRMDQIARSVTWTFPFGAEVRPCVPRDAGEREVFVLGGCPSALHV